MGDRSNKVSERDAQVWNGFPDDPDVPQWPGPLQEVGDQAAGEAVRRGFTIIQAAVFGAIASFGPDGCDWSDEDLAHAIQRPNVARTQWFPQRRKRDARKGRR